MMPDCKACGSWFAAANKRELLCPICERALARLAGYAAPVVRCKDCAYSTLPSELTQRYGKQGTLTCHNMHAPSNRRNVGSNDFCSYGERKDRGADNA